jgi:hypothetical protein
MSKKRLESESLEAESVVVDPVVVNEVPVKEFKGIKPKIWISTRRVDDICYELLEMRDGQINVVAKDALPIIRAQAEYYIQRLCDGLDV